jgi:nicotinate-nucleotide adenylyltransferase
MGADSFLGLRRWHRAAELPFVAPLIVASRPGQPLQDLKAALPPGLAVEPGQEGSWNESGIEVRTFVLMNQAGERTPFFVLPSLHVEISASEIRTQIHATSGSPAAGRDMVPPAVRAYIAQHALYRS